MTNPKIYSAVCAVAIFMALMVAAIPSYAQLGDTMPQCISKYGEPVSQGVTPPFVYGTSRIFKSQNYLIMVVFINDVAAIVTINKKDKSAMSNEEMERILAKNTCRGSWNKPEHSTFTYTGEQVFSWDSKRGGVAIYDSVSRSLLIKTDINAELSGVAWIGVINGMGMDRTTAGIVRDCLKHAGIKCLVGGDMSYIIVVRSDHVNEALEALTKESRLNGHWILLKNLKTDKYEQRKDTTTGAKSS
jgi:hypothetical protein